MMSPSEPALRLLAMTIELQEQAAKLSGTIIRRNSWANDPSTPWLSLTKEALEIAKSLHAPNNAPRENWSPIQYQIYQVVRELERDLKRHYRTHIDHYRGGPR